MKTPFSVLLALGLLLLSACKVEMPRIESCTIKYANGRGSFGPEAAELWTTQTRKLSLWLSMHSKGWTFKVTDNYPTGALLELKDKNGKVHFVNFRGNELWAKNRFLTLTPDECGELSSILTTETRVPDLRQTPKIQ